MVILPSPTQVARNHTLIYEAFYQQVDPAGKGCVVAADAAPFLKQSGLPDSVLSRIWDLSDPLGNGFLDKQGFFVALKLIALSQNGKDVGMANICEEVPPPQMQACTGRSSPAIDWSVKPSEYKKYEEMFNSLGPVGDRLPGHKVKPVMLNSKLPLDVLGKIWDLSDTDQDGFLTKGEFVLAMHLIYKALENIPVPVILPPELTAVVNKRNSIPGFTQVLPDSLISTVDNVVVTNSIRRSSTPSSDVLNKTTWVVNALDKAKYDKLFYTLDADADGFVTGADVRETLLHSGLSQSVLAHIWNLCDIKQNGKLNSEQFALAMYFVHQGLQGNEIPAALFPEMIPPTLRPKPPPDNQQESPLAMTGDHESSGSKELDLISNEIKELHTGKMSLEKDIAQKEADVKIKNGELKNLQNELEALETMLKQLEIQKGEARKRLNDLDKQKGSVDLMLCDVNSRMEDETNQVEALKKQREEQTTNLKSQEHELVSKRQELNDMQQEEIKFETQINNGRQQLDALNSTLQSTQLQISQIKLKIDQMQEQNRLITDAIQQLDYALSNGDFKNISEFTFSAIAPINGAEMNGFSPSIDIPLKSENGVKVTTPITDFEEDPFKSKDPFNDKTNGFVNDPFAGEDPFKSDPFKEGITTDDPFASDPFQEVFGVTQSDSKEDPFQGSDPFGSFGVTTSSAPKNDPFDPFGLSSNQPVQPVIVSGELVADPFGADPFGPGPVAPPRPESPTPALPPKKSKAPPPRPAPPKVASAPPIKSGPTRAAPAPPVPTAVDPFKIIETETTDSVQPFPDLFAQPTGNAFDPFISTDGVQADFANFADFDSVK